MTTNRFFFLSKGRTRRSSTRRAPFGVAYEIISPRITQLEAENLNNGAVERGQHDCYSVFQQGSSTPHYVELDKGEASTLSKLTLFMPDKRFRGLKYDPNTNTVDTDAWIDANYMSSAIPDDVVVKENEYGTETWTEQGKKEVKYIASMYSTRADNPQDETPQEQGAPRRMVEPHEDDVDSIYYVTEKELDVTYACDEENVITAIGSVMESSPVVSTNYYNLMGVSSDTPHRGINIVVTVHADGTVTSHKAIF